MNIHDATEQAYKNGYEQGYKDAVKDILEQHNKSELDITSIVEALTSKRGLRWTE